MQLLTLSLVLAALSVMAFWFGRHRALSAAGGPHRTVRLHSLPGHYGYYAAIWFLLPALGVLLVWVSIEPAVVMALVVKGLPDAERALPQGQLELLLNSVRNIAAADPAQATDAVLRDAALSYQEYSRASRRLLTCVCLGLAGIGGTLAWRRIAPDFRARNRVEDILLVLLLAASTIAILTTIGIVLSVLFESIRFFREVPITEFLFGLNWSPQTAIRSDQVGSSGSFGAVPLFTGTLLITAIAMFVSVPVGLMTAIYLAEYASARVRAYAKPLLEILAGIPTVVYGFFAALTMAPAIRRAGESVGLEVASESALAAGVVMSR